MNIGNIIAVLLVLILLLLSCSSTRLIKSWKNPEFENFKPEKILVIGVTPNYEARKAFEFQIITELNARKINALQSAVVFESSFQNSELTEKDIEIQVNKLISNGYETYTLWAATLWHTTCRQLFWHDEAGLGITGSWQ